MLSRTMDCDGTVESRERTPNRGNIGVIRLLDKAVIPYMDLGSGNCQETRNSCASLRLRLRAAMTVTARENKPFFSVIIAL